MSALPTISSPRGIGSSRGNYLPFLHFRFEIGSEGISEDVAERLYEMGIHFGGLSPSTEATGRTSEMVRYGRCLDVSGGGDFVRREDP